jgi:acyl carrier protein
MNNLEKLKQAFSEALNITDINIINNDLKYQQIEQWDSISHMVLIAEIEEQFNISIATSDVIVLSSFERAIEILEKYGINF